MRLPAPEIHEMAARPGVFTGRVAIVTGAGQGIGRAVAKAFAASGASVLLGDVNEATAIEAAKSIVDVGGSAVGLKLDVRKEADVKAAIDRTKAEYGRLDVLINNAGVSRLGTTPPSELAVEEFDDIIAVNLRGPFLMSKHAAPVMAAAGRGRIVNIASTRALMAEPYQEAYSASKGGLLSLTSSLAISLGPQKITVNAIIPGWIETGNFHEPTAAAAAHHPAQRVGHVDDVSRACLYFSDPANDFVTGTNVVVDGGMTKKMIYVS